MRVLVTGSIYWTDGAWVYDVLDNLLPKNEENVIVHGARATGVDIFVSQYCKSKKIKEETHPALRQLYGDKRADALRNHKMVSLGADICVGFPTLDSRNSWDCMARCERDGIRTLNMGEKHEQ